MVSLGIVFAALAMSGAPTTDEDAVGLVWPAEATVPADVRQRLVQAIAGDAEPRRVVDDADRHARVAVAVDLPLARAAAVVQLSEALASATTRFRGGDLAGATTLAQEVIAALVADPVLPGAATLAFDAHVLQAQVASAAGDEVTARLELSRAVAVDPDRDLSTRHVPPAVEALHEAVRTEILAGRDAWPRIEIVADPLSGPVMVEIDGVPGLRPVVPGMHFVVVRRAGRAPLGFAAAAGDTVRVPDQPEQIAVGLPADKEAAERVCDYAEVDRLVLAVPRDDRLALESFACGQGFAATWFSDPFAEGVPADVLAAGALTVATVGDELRPRSRLAGETPWPEPTPHTDPTDDPGPPIVEPPPKKPWFRRVWVWSLIGGAVAAGVTTGAVLGTRDLPSEIRIDSNGFLQ